MDGKNEKKRGGKQFTGEYQPSPAAKAVKKKKTRLKEAAGLESWEAIQNFLLTDGAGRFIEALNGLTDKSYVFSYLQAMEYFKPKLSRAEVTGKDGEPLQPPTINVIARKPEN